MVMKKNTIQRQLIANAVKDLNIHATAEQVFDHIIQEYPSIGRATVYRNLAQMAESGELLKFQNCSGTTHYDHNCHDHYHFVCNSCGCVFDVDGDFSDLIPRCKNTCGFDISECHVLFTGICWACKEKESIIIE